MTRMRILINDGIQIQLHVKQFLKDFIHLRARKLAWLWLKLKDLVT